MKALPAPELATRSGTCTLCRGTGLARVSAWMLPRHCPTCSGSGVMVEDGWTDPMDRRAYQIGLAPLLFPVLIAARASLREGLAAFRPLGSRERAERALTDLDAWLKAAGVVEHAKRTEDNDR